MSLTERIRTIARDVTQGDTDGTLREEVTSLRQYVDDELNKLQVDIQDLQNKVTQPGN